MKATLVLEDGSSFEGLSIGVPGEKIGEVILDTSVVGYQEMMTDPSNAGKILVLTYPLIGNYGVAKKFSESKKCWVAGLIIKESSRIYSNWQAEGSFEDFLKKEDVITMSGADTRTLAITLRDKGEMLGIVSTNDSDKEDLIKKLKKYKKEPENLIKEISVKKPVETKGKSSGPNIAVLDLGMLNSFIKQLTTLGCNITLLPYNTSAKDILALRADGLIISNGPEQDAAATEIVKTVKELLGKIPIMGISSGHEILGLAVGGKLIKMKIGHHGVNYPVKSSNSLKGEITVQNHSYIIDENSIKGRKEIKISLRNINDNSVEEIESRNLKFISVQYYPSSPGFDEVNGAFVRFLKLTGKGSRVKGAGSRKTASEVEYAKT